MVNSPTRVWEIDALRGMAIGMMVIYHLIYDLYYFQVTDVIFTSPFWFYFQRATAGTFLTLVGVSLTLSLSVMRRHGQSEYAIYGQLCQRGLRVFGWGWVITLATWFFFGQELAVRFGILHLIGLSTILVYPFLTLRWLNLALWIGLSLLGRALSKITITGPWLLWLGIQPTGHIYVDYFPLIPWFGVILLGIFLGNLFYAAGKRCYPLPLPSSSFMRLQWLGQHSLMLYLLHQPLLLTLLTSILWLWQIARK